MALALALALAVAVAVAVAVDALLPGDPAANPTVYTGDPTEPLWHYSYNLSAHLAPAAPNMPAMAYLWLPSNATAIRGIVVIPRLLPVGFAVAPSLRRAAQNQSLAIVYNAHAVLDVDNATYWEPTMASFAQSSGFPELEHAPLFPMGWSTDGPFAMCFAWKYPGRVFGFLYYKSGNVACPNYACPSIDPALCKGNTTWQTLPFLALNGECEEFGPSYPTPVAWGCQRQWKAMRDTLMFFRTRQGLVQQLVEPQATHLLTGPWFPVMVDYVALYLQKAAYYLIPPGAVARTGPVQLNLPNRTAGWLTDANIKPEEPLDDFPPRPAVPMAPYLAYTGNATQAYWHYDEELAQAWEKAQAPLLDPRKRQDPIFNNGTVLTLAGTIANLSVLTNGTGSIQYFAQQGHVRAAASAAVAQTAAHLPGQPAAEGLAGRVAGPPFEMYPIWQDADPDSATPGFLTDKMCAPTVAAFAEGTHDFRPAIALLSFPNARANTGSGLTQRVSCPQLPARRMGDPPFAVGCTNVAGLPLQYAVVSGPATLQGNVLSLHPFPSPGQDCMPVILEVTQWGNGTYRALSPPIYLSFPVCRS